MTVLNIKKARQEIRLTDEPDSPVYVLDLTDSALDGKLEELSSMLGELDRLRRALNEADENDSALIGLIAGFYRSVVAILLSEEAYDEIIAYVAGEHAQASDVNIVMTPLISYLLEQVGDALTANGDELIESRFSGRSGEGGV